MKKQENRRNSRFRDYKKAVAFLIVILIMIGSQIPDYAAASKVEVTNVFKNVKREVMPNGLTIITLQDPNSRLVSINFFVNTGSINENERIGGISHFCEHMFYRGSKELSGIDMKRAIENIGGTFNAETSRDYTRFFVNIPTEYGYEALKIYSDAFRNARYPEKAFEKEKQVILEEYNMTSDSPTQILFRKLYAMAFPMHPYGKDIIGTLDSIKNMSREDLLTYKNKWYTPENTIIVIVGNFDRNKYLSYIKNYFGDIPGGPPARFMSYPPDRLETSKYKIEEVASGSDKALFVLAYPSPGFRDKKDVVAMDLLTFMLGQGYHSILSNRLVKEKHLVNSIGTDYLTMKEPGLVFITTQVDTDRIVPLKLEILNTLDEIKEGKFSDEDMEKARKLLIKSYMFTVESNEGKADSLGFYEILGDLKFATDYTELINGVSREDVVRAAKKYFDDEYIFVALKPKKMKDEDDD